MVLHEIRVFFDADVWMAGSISSSGASHILLRLSEYTVLKGLTSQQAVAEAARNLQEKMPEGLPFFQRIVAVALETVPDPDPKDLENFAGQADAKDLPILVGAIQHHARYLVTFNVRDYCPSTAVIEVVRPGDFLFRVRQRLASLISEEERASSSDEYS